MKYINFFYLPLMILLTGCANQSFKAEEPTDYKDNAKYGFGSLIKGKDPVFNKYLKGNSSEAKEQNMSIKSTGNSDDKLWNATIVALKDFPISFMDKKRGIVETEKVKVEQFDNTNSCSYIIKVKLLNKKDFLVNVISNEDSAMRLRKHEEIIKSKIQNELAK